MTSPSPRSRSPLFGGRATGWCCSGTGPRPRASARGRPGGDASPADGDRLGDGPASGLWASDVAGAVGRALQHARLQGVAVVDVVLSGAAARERWLQQAAAEASGLDRVLALPYSAARGAAHLAVAAAPAPSVRLLRRPRRAPDRVRRGRPGSPRGTMPGWSRRPLTRPPDHFPQVRRGCPLPPAPPRQRRAGRAGAGRAGVVAVVLVVAVVIAAAVLFAPSLLTLRNADARPAGTSGGRGARTEPR